MCSPLACIYQSIEYIEAHLQCDLPVGEMAEAAGYSLFHFIRTFNRSVHHTPYDYLMRRRLSEAARALTAGRRRIFDIAQDYCFESQESFARAFKRLFEMQPSQWRDRRLDSPMLLMPPLTWADLEWINRDSFQFPGLVDLQEVTLYGLAAEPSGPAQLAGRGRLLADLNALYGGRVPGPVTAVTTYLDINCRTAREFAGTENKPLPAAHPPCAVQTLPASRYAAINAAGGARQPALNYLYFTWLPRMGLRPAGTLEIERIACEGDDPAQSSLFVSVAAS